MVLGPRLGPPYSKNWMRPQASGRCGTDLTQALLHPKPTASAARQGCGTPSRGALSIDVNVGPSLATAIATHLVTASRSAPRCELPAGRSVTIVRASAAYERACSGPLHGGPVAALWCCTQVGLTSPGQRPMGARPSHSWPMVLLH